VVAYEGCVDLIERCLIKHVPPDEVTELEECAECAEHLWRNIAFDGREVNLRDISG
jgi:hypothetical protein